MNRPGRRRSEDLTADLLADMATPGAAQPPRPGGEPPDRGGGPSDRGDGPPGPAFETTMIVSPLVWRLPRVQLEDGGLVGEFGPLQLRLRFRNH